ncbi:MAG TPA: DNA polymerase III subunit alpha, partial [Candidatus Portnoybacteria bacterium]|nr:DNA polymerase III subunit alpha [Candidatus Portnoybacteria bacterium]
LDYCQELGMNSIALTDHGNMYGVVEFFKKAKKRGIKPIIGSEFYLAPNGMKLKRPKIDEKRHHLVLLAKNSQGYQNLIKLTTKAHLEGFYYRPRIDKELLKKHAQGLIALSACLQGSIPQAIISGNFKKAEEEVLEYQEIFGPGNFYLELQDHPQQKRQEMVNKKLIELAKKHNLPLVATNDIHYLKPEDAEVQDILLCIQTNSKVEDEDRLNMKGYNLSMRSPKQMMESFKETPEAIENTQRIVEACNFELELGKIQLPYFKVPAEYSPDSYLKELVYQGLKEHYPKSSKEIEDRLEYELSVIKQTGYASYFLIVQDFVNWAKKQGIIVGPGRGSVAGSIVSYLLNITEVDPLKYELLFERFLNPERAGGMPDIDLDFADDRRDEVTQYVARKYGHNHVAQIITFGTMAARQAIRDTGRALGYSYALCDQIAKTIPMFSSLKDALDRVAELRSFYETDPAARKLIDLAKKLEGVARHASTHACGVVITKREMDQYVPRQHPAQDNQTIVTQYGMHAIEDLGLLKIDLLGLKNLTILEKTIKAIERNKKVDIDMASIPLDDKKTFQLLQQAKTTGVFQLESAGMKKYLKSLKPTKFEDIIAMVALHRPGPMEWISNFIARKHGYKKIQYIHPALKPILEKTYGIAVYQEQVLQIARDIAGFTLGEADILRKAMGKKIRWLLEEQREKFLKGAQERDISKEIAQKIFAFIEPFAGYGFNRAHATCYALIGYWTAYLKSHYPTEFMAALLTSDQGNIDRISVEVDECRQMGIEVLPPDINESLADFVVIQTDGKKEAIRFGLEAIKNVGYNVIEAITNERERNGAFESIDDFVERVESRSFNKKSLESLIKCGVLDELGERNRLLENLEQILTWARDIQRAKSNGQVSLFSASTLKTAPQLKLKDAPPVSKKEKIIWEKELLGLYISEHPVEEYREYLESHAVSCKDLSSEMVGRQIKIGGIINKIQKFITRTKRPMIFVQLEDLTSKIEVLVFPSILEKNPDVWREDKIVLVSGKLSDKDGTLKLLCNNAKEIPDSYAK